MLGRMSSLFEELTGEAADHAAGPPGRRRKRRRGLRILLALLLLVLATGAAGFSYYNWCRGGGGAQQAVTLEIPNGASGSEVVSMLHDKGVIRCGLVSRIVLRSKHETIQAGTYHLTTNMSLGDALDSLAKGPQAPPSIRFTIPPGWRITQIAERAQRLLGIPAKEFDDAAFGGGFALPPYLPKGTRSIEGFLLPNTYQFPEHGNTASSAISRLLGQFTPQAGDLPWGNASKLGQSDYQIVTIASMIEKETGYGPDRGKIAAVIDNRLRIGMALGIDATLLYDDPTPGDNTLSNSDLHTDGPYNTRLRTGLPPTPIASPSVASIAAALQPAHVNYLYYVKETSACGTPGHSAFTSSYAEFLRLKARCLGG